MLLPLFTPKGKAFNSVAHPSMSLNGWHLSNGHTVLHIKNPPNYLRENYGSHIESANIVYIDQDELEDMLRTQISWLPTEDHIFYQGLVVSLQDSRNLPKHALN